jgi:hypothetical protein
MRTPRRTKATTTERLPRAPKVVAVCLDVLSPPDHPTLMALERKPWTRSRRALTLLRLSRIGRSNSSCFCAPTAPATVLISPSGRTAATRSYVLSTCQICQRHYWR